MCETCDTHMSHCIIRLLLTGCSFLLQEGVSIYTHENVLALFLSISILQVVIIVMQKVNHPVVQQLGMEKVQMHRQQACSLMFPIL